MPQSSRWTKSNYAVKYGVLCTGVLCSVNLTCSHAILGNYNLILWNSSCSWWWGQKQHSLNLSDSLPNQRTIQVEILQWNINYSILRMTNSQIFRRTANLNAVQIDYKNSDYVTMPIMWTCTEIWLWMMEMLANTQDWFHAARLATRMLCKRGSRECSSLLVSSLKTCMMCCGMCTAVCWISFRYTL